MFISVPAANHQSRHPSCGTLGQESIVARYDLTFSLQDHLRSKASYQELNPE